MTKNILPLALGIALAACSSSGAGEKQPMTNDIRTREIAYDANGTPLRGYLAMPANPSGPCSLMDPSR